MIIKLIRWLQRKTGTEPCVIRVVVWDAYIGITMIRVDWHKRTVRHETIRVGKVKGVGLSSQIKARKLADKAQWMTGGRFEWIG